MTSVARAGNTAAGNAITIHEIIERIVKPVAVFRFSDTEGPGHFATFLDANRIPWKLVKLDEGEPVPASSEAYAGLAFMGNGQHLIYRNEVPVIGHCLGGQMLSRALGGTVRKNPVKEIGWNPVQVVDSPVARRWFGEGLREFDTFQWHGDTFSIPPGGERILTGPHCENQAYVVGDRHLGLQCHVEMTPDMIESWLGSGREELEANLHSPAVQPGERIRGDMARRLPGLSKTAERLYERWMEKLRR